MAAAHICRMPTLDLTDDERSQLIGLLRGIANFDPFPLSPRVRAARAILDKLEPSAPRAEPLPLPKPPGRPSMVRGKKQRG